MKLALFLPSHMVEYAFYSICIVKMAMSEKIISGSLVLDIFLQYKIQKHLIRIQNINHYQYIYIYQYSSLALHFMQINWTVPEAIINPSHNFTHSHASPHS